MNYTATEPEHSDVQRAGHAPIGSPEARGLEGPTGRPGIHRGFSIIYIYVVLHMMKIIIYYVIDIMNYIVLYYMHISIPIPISISIYIYIYI